MGWTHGNNEDERFWRKKLRQQRIKEVAVNKEDQDGGETMTSITHTTKREEEQDIVSRCHGLSLLKLTLH